MNGVLARFIASEGLTSLRRSMRCLLRHRLTVVTRNVEDFKHTGLALINSFHVA